MNDSSNLKYVPQCAARSKRSGLQCRQPAMSNKKVCRFHGGKSTGPKTKAGKERIRQANLVHGGYSKNAQELRLAIRNKKEGQKFIQSCIEAADQEFAKLKALEPYLKAFHMVDRQEEFDFISFFVFGRLKEQVQNNLPLKKLLIEFFDLLYDQKGFTAFNALLNLFDKTLQTKLSLPADLWRSLTPDEKQEAYINTLLDKFEEVRSQFHHSE